MLTQEWNPLTGQLETVDASFRGGYADPLASTLDWLRLMGQKRYEGVRAAPSLEAAANAVASAGYATDPLYAKKLVGITPRTPEQQAFMEQRRAEVRQQGGSEIMAELAARQAALESGWGRSAPGGNLYGIKGEPDARSGKTMDYTQMPDIALQPTPELMAGPAGPSGPMALPMGAQMPIAAPAASPAASEGGFLPFLGQLFTGQAKDSQGRGFYEGLMADPMWHMGLGVAAAPGYGGNWLRAVGAGMQQGMQTYEQRRKFEEEMGALAEKKRQREQVQKMAQALPEPFRSLVIADPQSYGNVLIQMMQARQKMAGPQGRDRYIEAGGRIFDTATQQYMDRPGGAGGMVDLEPKKKVEVAGQLRDDFRTEAKPFAEATQFYQRAKAATQGGVDKMTGADDIAIVFSFMKLLDPTSVVRETEYATASNAAGVPEHVRGLWNRLIGGGSLGPEARKQLIDQMERQYSVTQQNLEGLRKHYAQIGSEMGIPNNWLFREEQQLEYPQRASSVAPKPPPQGPGALSDTEKELEELLR